MSFILDTNVWSAAEYQDRIPRLKGILWCSVVVQEILVITPRKNQDDFIKAFLRRVEEGSGIVPDGLDWCEVGKCLSRLMSGFNERGLVLSKVEVNLLVRDALIARCAVRAKASVITNNISDFEKIKTYFRSLKILAAAEVFGARPR